MWLKRILIDKAEIKKMSDSKWELSLNVLPLDENGDLEPWVVLKVYVNDSLAKNLTSNEFGKVEDNFLINNVLDETKVQIRDVSENVRSKIKIVFDVNTNKEPSAENIIKTNCSIYEKAKEDAIVKLKADPNKIRWLSLEQKNDASIVKYALMQRWVWMEHVWDDVKDNKEMAEIAIETYIDNFEYISDRLKTDINFVLKLLKNFWDVFYLSDYVKNQKEIKDWLDLLNKDKNSFSTNKMNLFNELKTLNLQDYINRIGFYPYANPAEEKIPNLKVLVSYLDSILKKKKKHLSHLNDLRILENKYINNHTSSMNYLERKKDFIKIENLKNLIWDINLPIFSFYDLTDHGDDSKLSKYRSKILKDYNIYKQHYNKLKDLFLFYDNLKKKYPFFVDNQIEKMI